MRDDLARLRFVRLRLRRLCRADGRLRFAAGHEFNGLRQIAGPGESGEVTFAERQNLVEQPDISLAEQRSLLDPVLRLCVGKVGDVTVLLPLPASGIVPLEIRA